MTATGAGYSHTATVSLTVGQSTAQQNTFTTSPGGLSFAVDGTSYTTTQTFRLGDGNEPHGVVPARANRWRWNAMGVRGLVGRRAVAYTHRD
ncbi:MAG: hypothetical protein LAQ69_47510, partial [Acidobacteriia bacterium]|nr:hypothetical protein [Terriglobia bacterium]